MEPARAFISSLASFNGHLGLPYDLKLIRGWQDLEIRQQPSPAELGFVCGEDVGDGYVFRRHAERFKVLDDLTSSLRALSEKAPASFNGVVQPTLAKLQERIATARRAMEELPAYEDYRTGSFFRLLSDKGVPQEEIGRAEADRLIHSALMASTELVSLLERLVGSAMVALWDPSDPVARFLNILPDQASLFITGAMAVNQSAGKDALRAMNTRLHEEVISLVARKEEEAQVATLPAFQDYPLETRKHALAVAICDLMPELELQPSDILFRPTPPHIGAHFSVGIPKLQKGKKGGAGGVALDHFRDVIIPGLMAELPGELPWPVSIEQSGIYLNITLDRASLMNDTFATIALLGSRYGDSDRLRGERVLLDFSSPNTAKTMHVGHLRSTIIGQVMINLLEASGAITYGINHLGDWGTQFGQLVTAYRLWADEVGNQFDLEKDPVGFLAELYRRVKAKIRDEEEQVEEAEKAEKEKPPTPMIDDGRKNFAALEAGDPEVIALWKKFSELSLIDFERVYKRLGIVFDMVLGESFYQDKMDGPVRQAEEMGLARESEGALTVTLDDAGAKLGTFILRKTDEGSTYSTRDVAAVRYRRQVFHTTQILYVVGSEQKLHLAQVFELAHRLGDIERGVCEHINFGLIKQKGKKIASREGADGLDALLDRLTEGARTVLKARQNAGDEHSIGDEEIDVIAEQIGQAALIYANFMQSRERDMEFNPEAMLDLHAQSGPYLQYTAVRMKSLLGVLGTAEDTTPLSAETIHSLPAEAHVVVEALMDFPRIVSEAAIRRAPHLLAAYLYDLSGILNNLYTGSQRSGLRMKDETGETKIAYQRLISSALIVMKRGLGLLNINVPEKM